MNLFFDPNLNADSSEVFIDKSEIKDKLINSFEKIFDCEVRN